MEFLRRFTIEAYSEKGGGLSSVTSNWNGALEQPVIDEFRRTAEWQQFEEQLLAVAEHQAAPITYEGNPASRRASIDAFIAEVTMSGWKIRRKDIWIAANYKDATEFERFQRGDERATPSAGVAFRHILSMKPHEFIAKYRKQPSK
jgi:hypothetical protein